jgi:hypothetical protein
LVDPDTSLVKPVAHWGVEEGYLGKIVVSVKEVPEGLGPTSIAIRKGRPYVCNDIEHDLGMERARNEALKRGYRSTAAFPLRAEGRILGALVLYSKELHFFNDEEIQLLDALTDDLSFASQSVEHEKERKRAEDRLAKINECFLSFGPDPTGNIDRLTALCGEMMEPTSAFYNRLEGGVLRSVGQWHAPPDYTPMDEPDGHICHDVIQGGKEDVLVIRDLPCTQYAKIDPNVSRYRLQTYVILSSYGWGGGAIRHIQETLGPSKMEIVGTIQVNGPPSENDIARIVELGKTLSARMKEEREGGLEK